MTYAGLTASSITLKGNNGDEVEAYYARPAGPGPFPGVVVIHHAPGWDRWTTEVVHRFAGQGYVAISPHLYHRWGPGAPDDLAARARAEGGMKDADVMGDVKGAMDFLRAQPEATGKVGVIGFCSGGRHTFLAAGTLPGIDAAVDCWGGGVIVKGPEDLTPSRPVAPIDYADKITA